MINSTEVQELLAMPACIEIMETVLSDLVKGQAVQSLRSVVPLEGGNVMGLMPTYLKRNEKVGAKVITVFPGNHGKGLSSHQGFVSLFNSTNGQLEAIVDGTRITAIRTAAVSAAATKLLAKPEAATLAVIGTGEQARTHIEAMLLVRPITKIQVWGPNAAHAERLRAETVSRYPAVLVSCASSAQEAVADADIVCTVTASTTPIVQGAWIKEGAHVNAIGACRAKDRELDTELVRQAELFVDRTESAVNEAGDYLIPLQEGAIGEGHILAEMGELLVGAKEGRRSATSITLFKSLGLACEDLAAAHYIYKEAIRTNKGTHIDF
ncbi:Delta(1)-pyrroline-2-carboxylate reductase [Paenibacillus allorhizoplanae]|uniref:Delta(1)-pyrroline-2-carboxylate reductase n=1 Tax=Paenibacillus allorhizoplanae TaxID=2905648 RepID=A0ABM9C7E7_9BACL|nr:ornithine cyclodeaminase family protein [Paenibacillus allorhizoplanae]CAH1206010.1 Delta(1)-pyrroline-2-carboxylate reductase [Paenibacillus allorhizoplanae]